MNGQGPKRKSGILHVSRPYELQKLHSHHFRAADNSDMTAIREYPFDLSDLNDNQTITTQPDTRRKVSILADEKGNDNHAFERNPKLSTSSFDHGPARRKSYLHNIENNLNDKTFVEGRYKKNSTASSIGPRNNILPLPTDTIEQSCWYACCSKFHQDDTTIPSWEPPKWQKVCPYPLCPTYRTFAQTVSVVLIGLLLWIIVWTIVGDIAAPGGQLFGLAVLAIAANLGGWLFVKITTLPALIGMLLVGILMQNVGLVDLDGDFEKVCAHIRKFALVIILTRAGLDLDPPAMKRMWLTVLKLGLVPWTVECVVVAVMSNLLLGLPWIWAFLLGSVIAAVSPAVVVPCLFRLRKRGYGVAKGIPTLVLAVAGIDDAASVAIFGIINGVMFSTSSLALTIAQGPVSVILGIAFGVIWGCLAKYVPERNDAFVVPLRVLMLLCGGLVAVLGSEHVGWGGAGPLAVVAAAFVACMSWSSLGWEVEDNPVATAFEIFWMIFEPLLFGITGAQVKINELDPNLVLISSGCLLTGVVLRILVTAGIGFGSNLNNKEKFFVALSWMAKATVQAALSSVALDEVRAKPNATEDEMRYGEMVLTSCILSIVLTAPLGAIIISISGPRLLSKTSKPHVTEGWRRSHRPSIRDISIIDEEDDVDVVARRIGTENENNV